MTYDQLLAQGERLIEMLQAPEPERTDIDTSDFEDDLPW